MEKSIIAFKEVIQFEKKGVPEIKFPGHEIFIIGKEKLDCKGVPVTVDFGE